LALDVDSPTNFVAIGLVHRELQLLKDGAMGSFEERSIASSLTDELSLRPAA